MTHQKKDQGLTFSKKLTIVDTISWTVLTLILIVVILLMPDAASYCVSIATTITAAYVSLRLGYTGKAAIENYKKINNTMLQLRQDYDSTSDEDQDEDTTDEEQEEQDGNG